MHGTQLAPQLFREVSNPFPPEIAPLPPTPTAPRQNGRQIRRLPPTPAEILSLDISRDSAHQQQYSQYSQQGDQPTRTSSQHPRQKVHLPLQNGAAAVQHSEKMGHRRLRVTNPTGSEMEQGMRQRIGVSSGSKKVVAVLPSDERAVFRQTVEQLREQAKEKATLLRIRLAVGGMSQLALEAREQCIALLAAIKRHNQRALDEDQSDQLKVSLGQHIRGLKS